MSSQAVVVVLCALSLGATCYVIASAPRTADARIAELEKKLDAAEKRADAVESLRGDVRDLRDRLDRRAADVGRRAAPTPEPPVAAGMAAGSSEAAAGAATGTTSLEAMVADRVEKKVAEKLDAIESREKERGDDGKWKAPIDELGTELKLTAAQKEQARKIFDHSRDEAFTLLKTQRLDGGSLLDDFADALKSGVDPQEAGKQFFGRIFNEKVPGTDRTYLAEFLGMHQDVEEALGRQFEKDQMKRLKALHVDLLDVKTGYDPVGDYIRAKVQ